MEHCTECGKILVAGKNWYVMKTDHVCCDCSEYPVYCAKPSKLIDNNDYEGAILARQENY